MSILLINYNINCEKIVFYLSINNFIVQISKCHIPTNNDVLSISVVFPNTAANLTCISLI